MTNYERLINENLVKLFNVLQCDIEKTLPAERKENNFYFNAFGKQCCISPEKITFSGNPAVGPRGLLVSLYALHANNEPLKIEPFISFKDIPGSMPYHGAFKANSELILVPFVSQIKEKHDEIVKTFGGMEEIKNFSGDFSFVLFPFPKIALAYIFYFADDDFPPSATCLFSFNAISFMPLDGLADVAEYTSKGIIDLLP